MSETASARLAPTLCPTWGALLRRHARERPDAIALTFEGRDITYAEFAEAAHRIADALAEAGLTDGARIAYLGKNTADFPLLLVGAAIAGAVIVPINWRLSFTELVDILRDSNAAALLASEEFVET